ncbi:MAG: endonuclease domain-containing protein [Candidatus Nanopusillus acidilobi]
MSLWTTIRYYSDYQRLSPDQQRAFIEEGIRAQDYKCALCGGPLYYQRVNAPTMPVVDHDHKTGRIRGIIHSKCNSDLAVVENNGEEWIQKARKYLGYDIYVTFQNDEIQKDSHS